MNKKNILNFCLIICFFLGIGLNHIIANQNVLGLTQQGDLLLKQGNAGQAMSHYRRALDKNSNHLPALLGLSRSYMSFGYYDRASDIVQRALQLKVRRSEVYALQGEILTEQGDYAKAMSVFNQSLKIEPGNFRAELGMVRLYRLRGHWQAAMTRLERLQRRFPMEMEIYYEKIPLLLERKRWNDVEENLRKVKYIAPYDPRLYYLYSQYYTQRYYHSKSEEKTRQYLEYALERMHLAAKIAGNNPLLLEQRSYIYILLKEWDKANEDLTLLTKLIPDNYYFQFLAGYAAEKKGDFYNALAFYEKAFRSGKSDSVIRIHLERFVVQQNLSFNHPLRRELGEERYRSALTYLRRNLMDNAFYQLNRSLWLDPNHLGAREERLNHYKYMGQFPEYLTEVKATLDRIPPQMEKKRAHFQFLYQQLIRERRNKLYFQESLSFPFVHHPLRIFIENPKLVLGQRSHPGLDEILQDLLHFKFSMSERILSQKEKDDAPNHLVLSTKISEAGQRIQVLFSLKMGDTGDEILRFTLDEHGSAAMDQLVLRAYERIMSRIPVWGRVIKQNIGNYIINLGKKDGISEGMNVRILSGVNLGGKLEEMINKPQEKKNSSYLGKVVAVDSHVAKIILVNTAEQIWFDQDSIVILDIKDDKKK